MAVKEAFDHVKHRRLLTMIVTKKLDRNSVKWTENVVTIRIIKIMVDGFDGEVS
jgi:hypothetical protein